MWQSRHCVLTPVTASFLAISYDIFSSYQQVQIQSYNATYTQEPHYTPCTHTQTTLCTLYTSHTIYIPHTTHTNHLNICTNHATLVQRYKWFKQGTSRSRFDCLGADLIAWPRSLVFSWTEGSYTLSSVSYFINFPSVSLFPYTTSNECHCFIKIVLSLPPSIRTWIYWLWLSHL